MRFTVFILILSFNLKAFADIDCRNVYDVLETCRKLNPADEVRIERYRNSSILKYYLDSAKRFAESGGNPESDLQIAANYAEKVGRNIEPEKCAYKYIYEKHADPINQRCKDKDLRDTLKERSSRRIDFKGSLIGVLHFLQQILFPTRQGNWSLLAMWPSKHMKNF